MLSNINKNVLHKTIKYPKHMDQDAKDLCQKLLIKDPNKRLGCTNIFNQDKPEEIMAHPFFNDINWDELLNENKHINNKNYNYDENEIPYFKDYKQMIESITNADPSKMLDYL